MKFQYIVLSCSILHKQVENGPQTSLCCEARIWRANQYEHLVQAHLQLCCDCKTKVMSILDFQYIFHEILGPDFLNKREILLSLFSIFGPHAVSRIESLRKGYHLYT